MTSGLESPISAALQERVKNILRAPKAEWERIDLEPATPRGLFTGYAVILAAIGPVCSAIGAIVFGYGVLGFAYRPPIVSVIVNAIVSYILALASVFVLGIIIEALAPNFGGVKNRVQALKVAVYSSTAAWLVGVVGIYPPLAPLAILGLYSLYLLYLGLPRLMKAPEDKALSYTAVVVVVAIVLSIVVGVLLIPLHTLGMAGGFNRYGAATAPGGQISIGGATVDTAKLQAASAQLQAQAAALQAQAAQTASAGQSGAPAPGVASGLAPDALKALLPDSIAGFARGDTSSESAGVAGVGGTHAEAQYTRGDAHMTLEITDMAAMGALGALAGAMNVNSSKDTATGYERVSTINGRMTTEEYDRSSKHGKFGVMAAGHVMVEAEGDNVSIDELKAAVSAVGPDRVEALTPSFLNQRESGGRGRLAAAGLLSD